MSISSTFTSESYVVSGVEVSYRNGWEIRVLEHLRVPDRPLPVAKPGATGAEWAEAQRQREAILVKAPLVPVLHAYAGMVFSGMTAAQALDNLEYLRECGVAVPARTIEAMRQEAEA